jgi:hypothetical protein
VAYVKRKRIKGREYYYLAESYRAGGKVKTRTLAYLGTTPQVPKELTHLLGKSRRRRQRSLWDPEALGRAIAQQVMSQMDKEEQLG